ncbi:hypothetical protein KPNIH31_07010 [Klebsiella pneumoniae subsp. pneumoniae]|nr:hypothetical protein KPNIH31_07010 [Klebsiella pneumoniae subsp. pneumoniae]
MVKKSLRQFTLMATATVTLLLGSVPLYAQTADVQQKLAELERQSGGRLGVALINTADNSQDAVGQFSVRYPAAKDLLQRRQRVWAAL